MLRSQNRNPARLATLRALVLRRVLSLLMIAATSVWAGLAGAADRAPCEDEVPCQLDDGAYYLATPEDWDGESTLPVIMFFHGHRSSGRSVMRGGVRRIFGEAGYAVIAPNGPQFVMISLLLRLSSTMRRAAFRSTARAFWSVDSPLAGRWRG